MISVIEEYYPALKRLRADQLILYSGAIEGTPEFLTITLSAAPNMRTVIYSAYTKSWALETPIYPRGSYFPFAHGTIAPDADRVAVFEAAVREHMAAGWQNTVMDKIRVLCG